MFLLTIHFQRQPTSVVFSYKAMECASALCRYRRRKSTIVPETNKIPQHKYPSSVPCGQGCAFERTPKILSLCATCRLSASCSLPTHVWTCVSGGTAGPPESMLSGRCHSRAVAYTPTANQLPRSLFPTGLLSGLGER